MSMHNFFLVGEMFLSFILRVEAIEIRIWIEFKFVAKYKMIWKKFFF
jgi:hypothetical protein